MLLPSGSPHYYPLALALVSQLILSPIDEAPTVKVLIVWATADILHLGIYVQAHGVLTAAHKFLQFNATYFAALILFAGIYRFYLHPLRHFPGTKLAALTKLNDAYIQFHGQNAVIVREQHRRLGDFVRVGPNELSINNIDGLKLLLRTPYRNRGPSSEVTRISGGSHVQVVRDNAVHRRLRSIWDQAFKKSALDDYCTRVEDHVARFIEVLDKTAGEAADAVSLTQNLAFDIMADLGFGLDNYGMQDGTGDKSYPEFMHAFVNIVAIFASLRNLCDILTVLPKSPAVKSFHQKRQVMLDNRIKLGTSRKDVFSQLLMEDRETGTKISRSDLGANADLLIVAGADTTSTVMANMVRQLALRPEIQQKLYEEVNAVQGPLNCQNTSSLRYLQAVVDETLRLYNPVPSGAQHMTGPDGATVAGRYIPPCTVVRLPHFTLMRDERYFPQGDEFIPERWTEKGIGGVKNMAAFIPFSYGPHSCVGKQLALSEMRLSIASAVRRFKIEAAERCDEESYMREMKDFFVLSVGSFTVKFAPRKE